jgi:calcineurin-like phosphoesterase family protein
METTYLVEIRLAQTKWRIRTLIAGICGQLRLEPFMERHPHVTLFGPLTLRPGISSDELLETIGRAASGTGPIPFLIDGWEMRRGMHGSVIAFTVVPSGALRNLTRSLAGTLRPISESLNAWDSQPEKKWFHVTIANRLGADLAESRFSKLARTGPAEPGDKGTGEGKAGKILSFFRRLLHLREGETFRPPLLDGTGLRITVMQNNDILAEYDLLEKRWIYGDHSHDSVSWRETLGRYRQSAGFELAAPIDLEPGEVFVIADLHLGHANIIRYCSRPFLFSDCTGMDDILIGNWNRAVGREAQVFHLGDLQYGRGAPPVAGYLARLGGRATFIQGNHDAEHPGWVKSAHVSYAGIRFFLVHDPAEAPPDFDGWIIHGHHHNNELGDFPFMNFPCRRINVSAEVAGYVPVSLREIVSRIEDHAAGRVGDTILLRYPHVCR